MKLHLTAKAPNEGARLLARWIMGRHGGDLCRASAGLVIDGMALQRIVAGEIVPGRLVGACLHRHAGTTARDFNSTPRASWFVDADAAPLAEAA